MGKNELLFQQRYAVCRQCPLNSKNQSSFTHFQKMMSLLGEFCTDCGCPLKSKLTEPLSECPKLYWGQEVKNQQK